MLNVLVVMSVTDTHKKQFADLANECRIKYIPASQVIADDVADTDIIIGNISPALLAGCRNLKLLQLNSAGTDGYTADGILPDGAVLTNATGAYGLAISEHMLGMLLCLMKKLGDYRIEQNNRNWTDLGPVTSIYGSNTLVVGLGDIGCEFARRMNALGSTVTGIKRTPSPTPEYVKDIYQMDSLYKCLESADIVASCLPGTKETFKLYDRKAFSHMKKGAYFINIGRGNAVDTDSLIEALESGHLAGAAVDVTDPEPLPADHRLWSTRGILISPHVSGGFHLQATHDRIISIAINNIRHCIANEPFENIVDMNTGYRKNY